MSRLPRILALCACALTTTTCVLPEVDLGLECTSTSECSSDNVCVPLDEGDANFDENDAVCLPMLELSAPQQCTEDEDCPAAGWPIDATCNDERRCTCEGRPFENLVCVSESEVLGEHTCRCAAGELDAEELCEDDNQCTSEICGDGNCTEGLTGDGCDSDKDCPFSLATVCEAGACI